MTKRGPAPGGIQTHGLALIDKLLSPPQASDAYKCRSATYDSTAKVCRMTEETRRSAPSDFRPADRGVDYIENECAEGKLNVIVNLRVKGSNPTLFFL